MEELPLPVTARKFVYTSEANLTFHLTVDLEQLGASRVEAEMRACPAATRHEEADNGGESSGGHDIYSQATCTGLAHTDMAPPSVQSWGGVLNDKAGSEEGDEVLQEVPKDEVVDNNLIWEYEITDPQEETMGSSTNQQGLMVSMKQWNLSYKPLEETTAVKLENQAVSDDYEEQTMEPDQEEHQLVEQYDNTLKEMRPCPAKHETVQEEHTHPDVREEEHEVTDMRQQQWNHTSEPCVESIEDCQETGQQLGQVPADHWYTMLCMAVSYCG